MGNAHDNTEEKYGEMLDLLAEANTPFMIAGAFSLGYHTGLWRDTKDIDIFCKYSDSTRFIKFLKDAGYKVEIPDPRWLAKAYNGENFIDIIYSSLNGVFKIDDDWLEHAVTGEMFGRQLKIIAPEELIWAKAYVQEKIYFQGADINHVILKKGDVLDWKRLLNHFDHHWQLLFSILMNFRFVYPSSRNLIPPWVINELVGRLNEEMLVPEPKDKVCLGPLLSRTQYEIDLNQWGFKTVT